MINSAESFLAKSGKFKVSCLYNFYRKNSVTVRNISHILFSCLQFLIVKLFLISEQWDHNGKICVTFSLYTFKLFSKLLVRTCHLLISFSKDATASSVDVKRKPCKTFSENKSLCARWLDYTVKHPWFLCFSNTNLLQNHCEPSVIVKQDDNISSWTVFANILKNLRQTIFHCYSANSFSMSESDDCCFLTRS